MKREWLTERCTTHDPRELRLQGMASLKLSDDSKQKLLDRSEPFRQWVETKWSPFIAQMLPEDELWRFRSPPNSWANKAGRAGYAIVRDGVVIDSLVTLLN